MQLKQEEQILKIIKYTPSIFILITAFLVTLFFYNENKKIFDMEKVQIENEYFFNNEEVIKSEVSNAINLIQHFQTTTEEELKKNIKARVYEAYNIVDNIYKSLKDSKSNEEILKIINKTLSNVRFNDNRGYFFIYDINGTNVSNPIDKSFEGNNFFEYEDVNGYKFFQTMIATIKDNSERFDEYYWFKPAKNKEIAKKISFYKSYQPLNIVIGTGEYIEDFEKEIQKRVLEFINLIKFGENGYIFIFNEEKIYLSHIDERIIGKKLIDIKSAKNIEQITSSLFEASINGDGFYSYIHYEKPDTKQAMRKITYVKRYDYWNWIVGAGFYEDDLLNKINEKKEKLSEQYNKYIKNILILSTILTIVLLIISRYVSNFLETKFNQYKKELDKKQMILHQQSKMAAMGEMIANIAHQWRQPLSTITTASSGMRLQKELGLLTDEFFDEATNKISTSSLYLSQTIDDFRNFFSPNKQKSSFYIKTLVDTTLNLISTQFKSKDIEIINNIENVEIYNYENELMQALINILNNAKDELIKKDYERFIFIDIYKNEEELIISVKDNAGGIKEENLEKIFEPYFTTKHQSQGTGIGLYMTEEIITKHLNGTIEAENIYFTYNNKQYKGASFTIRLDIKK